MAIALPQFAELALEMDHLRIPIQLNTNTTVASILGFSRFGLQAQIYCHDDGQSIPSDAGFVQGDLSNTAGSGVVGVYIPVGDASEVYEIRLDATSIVLVTATGWTGITVTRKGASSTGVTTGKNISFLMTTTSLDLHAATGTAQGMLNVIYRKSQPAH